MELPNKWPGRSEAVAIATAILLCDPEQLSPGKIEEHKSWVRGYLASPKPRQKDTYHNIVSKAKLFGLGD